MAKKCPYETLGVAKDAKPDVIRKAGRRKSQETHPDRFDNTGDDSDPSACKTQAQALLASCLLTTLRGLIERGLDLSQQDVIASMRNSLAANTKNIKAEIKRAEKARDAIVVASKRLKDKSGFLEQVVKAQVANVDGDIERMSGDLRVHNDAVEYLKGCSFGVDKAAKTGGFLEYTFITGTT